MNFQNLFLVKLMTLTIAGDIIVQADLYYRSTAIINFIERDVIGWFSSEQDWHYKVEVINVLRVQAEDILHKDWIRIQYWSLLHLSLSQLIADPSRECLTPKVDRLTILCGAKAMPDNRKWRPYFYESKTHTS